LYVPLETEVCAELKQVQVWDNNITKCPRMGLPGFGAVKTCIIIIKFSPENIQLALPSILNNGASSLNEGLWVLVAYWSHASSEGRWFEPCRTNVNSKPQIIHGIKAMFILKRKTKLFFDMVILEHLQCILLLAVNTTIIHNKYPVGFCIFYCTKLKNINQITYFC